MFTGKVAKWWLPDDVLMLEELPHTATGKLNKLALRARYQDHLMENAKSHPLSPHSPSRDGRPSTPYSGRGQG
jgi:fatty-acyl-CoA synthase